MADGIEKDMAIEEGGDVKLDIAFGNDKEVDIANFVDGEPSNGLARPTKKSWGIVKSNEGEKINFEDWLAYQKATKK